MKKCFFNFVTILCITSIFTILSPITYAKAAEKFDEDTIKSEGVLLTSSNAIKNTQKYKIGDYINGKKVVDVQYVSISDINNDLNVIKKAPATTNGIFLPEYYYENYRSYILEGELESLNHFPPGTPKWTYTVEDSYTVETGLGVSTEALEATFSITIGNSQTRTIEWTGNTQNNDYYLAAYPVFTHIFADLYEDDVWNDDYLGEVWFYRVSGYNIYIVTD